MATKEICYPCLRGDQEIPAKTWCSDCEEKLCENCDTAHRLGKLTLSHRLNDLKELSSVPKNTVLDSDQCDYHKKPLDFFCTFHDVLCCRVCIPTSHKICDKIESIDDICENIRSSALVESMSEAVSSLLVTSNSIILNRQQNVTTVKLQKKNIKDQIINLKSNLTVLFDKLEKSLLEQLDTLEGQTASELESEIEQFVEIRKEMQDIKHELDFNITYGSNRKLFLLVQKLKQKVQAKDTSVQDNLSNMNSVSLDYTEDSNLSTVIESLADISVRSSAVDLKHKPFTQSSAQRSINKMLSLTPSEPIDLSRHGTCFITAIELIAEDKLLLVDYHGKRILLYKEDGTFLKKKQLDGHPYQIAILHDRNQAAIPMIDETRIVIIDCFDLKIIRQVNTKACYNGILGISDKFIVGGKNELDIFSNDGKLVRTITVSKDRQDYIRYIHRQNDGNILYTDTYKMYCVDLIDGTKVFEYKANTEARGIAQDKYGYIYVADKGQHNIHRLTPTGAFVDVLLTEKDIKHPLAITFSRDNSRLFVCETEKNCLSVFCCK